MTSQDKELLLYRILAGTVKCKIYDEYGRLKVFTLKKPTIEQKCEAEEIYHELLVQYQFDGLYTDEELDYFLQKKKIWTIEDDTLVKNLNKEIEEFKVGLLDLVFQSNKKKTVKSAIRAAEAKRESLLKRKHEFSHLSASGAAAISKMKYLIKSCLKSEDNLLVDDAVLDMIISYCNEHRMHESQFREIARTEPWRSYWLTKKACSENVFGCSSIELSDEQKFLVYWTCLYDSAYESGECPSEDVINDDDCFDGWMIRQSRERKSASDAKAIGTSDKFKGDEVFLPADTIEDARRIEALNDSNAKSIKKQRDKTIEKLKEVQHIRLPDVKKDLKMQITKKINESMKQQ